MEMKDFITAFHYCVPEVHATNWERNEFPRRCQPRVTSFVPDKDIPQSLYLFFFFPGSLGRGGCFVSNLLLAVHTVTTYVLRLQACQRHFFFTCSCLGVLCAYAPG